MRREQIPLFALESQDSIRNFDFLGITIQYEMCYTNILQILDLSGIPLLAVDRSWEDPGVTYRFRIHQENTLRTELQFYQDILNY